jgi:hypothetical protein
VALVSWISSLKFYAWSCTCRNLLIFFLLSIHVGHQLLVRVSLLRSNFMFPGFHLLDHRLILMFPGFHLLNRMCCLVIRLPSKFSFSKIINFDYRLTILLEFPWISYSKLFPLISRWLLEFPGFHLSTICTSRSANYRVSLISPLHQLPGFSWISSLINF